MKRAVIGILAHVDAGKTTCIEGMLYQSGRIRKPGRVDHRDTVLDYDPEERSHGITIYSKEAYFTWKNTQIQVIDTPGHVDFSSEMERTLGVIDFAVILINGQDGVQSHTRTIWKCLEHYHVPAIIFVNKMDISYLSREKLLDNLEKTCSESIIDFEKNDREEKLAMCSDILLSEYAEKGKISEGLLRESFYERKFFPCFFGSALKLDGLDALMNWIDFFTMERVYPDTFGAKVYRVSEDEHGARLAHVRITGGTLKTKDIINNEKVDQIRLYTGSKFETVNEASAGMVCVLKGLNNIEVGSGLGFEKDSPSPVLTAYMDYRLVSEDGADQLLLNRTCRKLSEEDPSLEMTVNEQNGEIHLHLMGEMQMEVLAGRIFDQCGIHVAFDHGDVIYEETIRSSVEGAGHYEPLRHYAEVHVRLDPLPAGSGITVESSASLDDLPGAWQKSILNALLHKKHKGVLTGSLLTDVKITLLAGRGSSKHTGGGDFRQAACRAVRQALMKAENILLEPYYSFSIDLPRKSLSRALYDLDQRHCTVSVQEEQEDMARIIGEGPVRLLSSYQGDLNAYTAGRAHMDAELSGYHECKDQEKIVKAIGYDPDMDQANPSGSVFCEHGAGYFVPWNKADECMHVQLKEENNSSSYHHSTTVVSEEEMNRIFAMTYGRNQNENKKYAKKKEEKDMRKVKASAHLEPLLIIDGYNMIYAWDDTKQLAKDNLSLARDLLIEKVMNYQGYTGKKIIIVFDGYLVKDNYGTIIDKGSVRVVYTKTDETADAWIERFAYEHNGKYELTVATSDGLIQNSVFSQGALRMSARELLIDMQTYDSLVRKE